MNTKLEYTKTNRAELTAHAWVIHRESKPSAVRPLINTRALSSSALANIIAFSAFTLPLLSASLAAADPTQLEEVVVSGVADPRIGSLLTSTEIRTTSVEEQITLPLSIGSLADALPGVSLNGQGGLFQSYSMRGFSRWRIRTEISGVPILTDRRAGNSLSFLPPELIDTIQVNMGPASSLYGSGAMGGVMNVSLLNPTATSVSVSGSSMGNAREVSLKIPVKESTSVVGSIREASNGKSGDGTPLNTRFEQSAFYIRNKSSVNDTEVSTEVLVSNGDDIGKSSALFPNARVTNYPHDNHRLLNIRATTPNNWFVQTYAHQQEWASTTLRGSGLRNTSDYSSMTIGGLLSRTSQSDQSIQRYGLDLTRRYGVDITETIVNSEAELASRKVVNDGTEWTAGLFWERTWYLNGLSLQGGLRADRARHKPRLAPRISQTLTCN